MAKVTAPLFSFGARAQIGKAIVYFPWKGLNVVREHVVPSNPKTTGQTTQRSYLTAAVDRIHDSQASASHPLDEEDIMAYALLGSTRPTPRTWFNEAVKLSVDNQVAGHREGIHRDGHLTPGADKLDLEIFFSTFHAITAATIFYGTSKTALVHSKAATVAADKITCSITSLVTGVKYYVQVRPTAPASTVLLRSGIYYGVPT